jgi:hypothetical protein
VDAAAVPVQPCAGPNDCIDAATSAHVAVCCIDKACVVDPPTDCTDANVQPITAANYSQFCRTDSDCIEITEGNGCDPVGTRMMTADGQFTCFNAAINFSGWAHYMADVAKTSGASCYAVAGTNLTAGLTDAFSSLGRLTCSSC